jgi:hypothetical protein
MFTFVILLGQLFANQHFCQQWVKQLIIFPCFNLSLTTANDDRGAFCGRLVQIFSLISYQKRHVMYNDQPIIRYGTYCTTVVISELFKPDPDSILEYNSDAYDIYV